VFHPDSTVRTIASGVGITERATLAILRDLDDERIVLRRKAGRRNTYSVSFSRLALMGRGNRETPDEPRAFVEALIGTLFSASRINGAAGGHQPPDHVAAGAGAPRVGSWGFFTNHLNILVAIARDGTRTVRELAAIAGITERATVAILNQLEAEGIITRSRAGRRNHYRIDFEAYRNFRGWHFDTWQLPSELVDVATRGIRAMTQA
jgi:DNA-binding Lrp family transcriptional regulator